MNHRASHRWHWPIIAAAVVGGAVIVILAVTALRTRRQVRQAAVASLTNYLAVALDRYATGTEALFRQGFYPAIPLAGERPAGPAAIRSRLDRLRADPCRCLPVPEPSVLFSLADDPTGTRAIDSANRPVPLDPAIATAIATHRPDLAGLGTAYGIVMANTRTGDQLVFFGGDPVAGYAVPATQVGALVFEPAFTRTGLVPRHLRQRIPGNDRFVSLSVTTAGGAIVFQTAERYDHGQSEGLVLPPLRGALTLRANLNPELKDLLVPGGVPPLVPARELLLLALALLLWIAIAIVAFRAADLARLRSDFVSSVSHELRTPLTQIRLAAETIVLGRSRDRESERRSLASVIEEATRLEQLIDNVLHWSRAERRLTSVAPRDVPLAEEVRKVVRGFEPLVADTRVRFAIAIADQLRATVDPAALRQVLLNLLDNAVRYGPEGQTITIAATTVDGRLEITVDDQGPGIPPGKRERAWQPFVRLDESDRAIAGTGLGLAVARELVEAHHGRCRIEASRDGGARVVLSLPLGATG